MTRSNAALAAEDQGDLPDGTDARLIQAAERMFAAHGVGAVSLRAVMAEARTNVASVHYHFGSKQALLDAVVRSRLDQVTALRRAVLDDLANTKRPSERDLAQALIGPIVEIAQTGGRSWVRLIGALMSSNDPALAPISDTFFSRNARFVDLMRRHSPHASQAILSFRLTQAMTLTLNVLGNGENVQSLMAGGGEHWDEPLVIEQLLDVVTSILAGPPRRSRS